MACPLWRRSTVSLAATYTVQSTADVVTVQKRPPPFRFSLAMPMHSNPAQTRTLFIGSTVALATTYAHLINGRVSLSSGGESYEVRRNILQLALHPHPRHLRQFYFAPRRHSSLWFRR